MVVGVVLSAVLVGMTSALLAMAAGLELALVLACYPAGGLTGVMVFLGLAPRRPAYPSR